MSENNSDFNLDDRILCPDDTCIGLVGPDGRCKVCKTPYSGELPGSLASDSPDLPLPEEEAPLPEATKPPGEDDSELVDDEDRRPCLDETCIGVIGPDGLCGTCGLAAKGS